MANARIGVDLDPVNTKKVDQAFARLQAKAKGIDFGAGQRSLEKLSRPLGKITGQANEFQKSLEASNARVLAFGASVAVINKLSEAFQALVTNTIKVEQTFAKINVILGGTRQEIEKFGRGIFEVAKTTGTSFDQVAEGALELSRQGLGVAESLSRVETSLKLVRVAGIDSQQAVAGLTAAIKGFQGAGLTVAAIGDKLAEVDTKFAVSTEDLINGLERASASARVAGVSFDELLGIVTTVQERTQRGGAVIGNAFKTIFARLQRTDTLNALKNLGIDVLDTSGNVREAVPLFMDLAAELDKLGLKSIKAGQIIQKVAGVRQRDILISLVEDLNSSQSQFAKAVNISAGAVGSLDRKNSALNNTLAALINNLQVSGQQLASTIGEIGFTESAADLVKIFGQIVNNINSLLDGEGVGSRFAQGLVKGIGSILTGPGLGLVGAIFIKLFKDLSVFGATALKDLLGINAQAQQQAALQQSVLQTLLQNENIQREILKLEGNKVAQEQLLLKIYNQQAAALSRVQKAAATVTPGLFGKGFRGGAEGVGKASGGYIAGEKGDVARGVGGANPGSKVVSIPNFAFGGGKKGTMVANTSEYIVPNFAGGGDAIFNQNMVKSMGLPAGAKKIRAAGGFIPNFARESAPTGFQQFLRGKGLTAGSFGPGGFDKAYMSGNRYRKEYDGLSPTERRNITKRAEQSGVLKRSGKGRAKYGLIYSDIVGGTKAQKVPTSKGNLIQTIPVDTNPPDALYKQIRDGMVKAAVQFAATLGISPDIVNDSSFKRGVDRSLNPGSVDSAFGTVFESAFQGAIGLPQKSNAIFDLPNRGSIQALMGKAKAGGLIEKISGPLSTLDAADFKNALNAPNINSMDRKIANRAAGGFIPNFADPLLNAVNRERAAGLGINQIRINQSGKLRNAKNPMGLAVTNTRDEPTGAIPNFARTGSNEELTKTTGDLIGKLFALQLATSALTSVVVEEEGKMKEFGTALSNTINTMLVLNAVGIRMNPFTKGMPKFMGGITKFGRGLTTMAPLLGGVTKLFMTLKNFAGPIAIGLTVIDGLFRVFNDGKGIIGTFSGLLAGANPELKKFEDNLKGLNQATLESRRDEEQKNIDRLQGRLELAKANQAEFMGQRGPFNSAGELTQNRAGTTSTISGRTTAGTGVYDTSNPFDEEVKGLQDQIQIARRRMGILNENLGIDGNTSFMSAGDFKAISPKAAAERLASGIATNRGGIVANQFSGRRDAISRRLGSGASGRSETFQLEQEQERLKLKEQQALKNLDIESSLINQLNLEKNLVDFNETNVEKLLQMVDGNLNIQQIQNAIAEMRFKTGVNVDDIITKVKIQAAQQKAVNEADTENLKLKQQQAKSIEDSVTGLQGYRNELEKQMKDTVDNMPRDLANNLENALLDTMDKVGDGTVKTLGDAFGNVALGFLRELQSAINKLAVQKLMGSITGQGSFLENTFSGITEALGFARGGLVTGGSGVKDDVPAKLMSGEYVVKKSAVSKYGIDFLQQLNNGMLQGYQSGGLVQGADNTRTGRFFDDTRGYMFGGTRSNRYLEEARQRDFFMPGDRGFGSIVGKENLLAFSEQQVTSGATDQISYGASGGSLNLELQSSKLSAFARRRMSPARQALMDAQGEAYGLAQQSAQEEQRVIDVRDQAKKARREALKQGIKSAFVNAAVAGVSASLPTPSPVGTTNMNAPGYGTVLAPPPGGFAQNAGNQMVQAAGFYGQGAPYARPTNPFGFDYGRQNGGVAPAAPANSMLMDGEFVVNANAARMIGRENLDSINMGNYQNGGAVGSVAGSSNSKADVENLTITINIDEQGNGQVSSDSGAGGQEQGGKEFARKVKDVVLNVIQEEKRVAGSLFTRNK